MESDIHKLYNGRKLKKGGVNSLYDISKIRLDDMNSMGDPDYDPFVNIAPGVSTPDP